LFSGLGGEFFKRGRLFEKPPLESDSFGPFLAETRKGHFFVKEYATNKKERGLCLSLF